MNGSGKKLFSEGPELASTISGGLVAEDSAKAKVAFVRAMRRGSKKHSTPEAEAKLLAAAKAIR